MERSARREGRQFQVLSPHLTPLDSNGYYKGMFTLSPRNTSGFPKSDVIYVEATNPITHEVVPDITIHAKPRQTAAGQLMGTSPGTQVTDGGGVADFDIDSALGGSDRNDGQYQIIFWTQDGASTNAVIIDVIY